MGFDHESLNMIVCCDSVIDGYMNSLGRRLLELFCINTSKGGQAHFKFVWENCFKPLSSLDAEKAMIFVDSLFAEHGIGFSLDYSISCRSCLRLV